jgi:hypothetical protein
MHITTKVVSSNLVHGQDVLYATLCDKTDRHDLTELLLKVALNTIALTQFTDFEIAALKKQPK